MDYVPQCCPRHKAGLVVEPALENTGITRKLAFICRFLPLKPDQRGRMGPGSFLGTWRGNGLTLSAAQSENKGRVWGH